MAQITKDTLKRSLSNNLPSLIAKHKAKELKSKIVATAIRLTLLALFALTFLSCIGLNVNCASRAGYKIGKSAHYTAYRY